MASSRSVNTMQELLQKMMTDISIAKALPDADLEFLIGLETTILTKLREPVDAMAGQLGGGPEPMGPEMGGPIPAPPPGAGPPIGGPPIGPGGPGPVPGIAPVAGAGGPNPDELRRMVGG